MSDNLPNSESPVSESPVSGADLEVSVPAAVSTDELLPPVEAPTAGFIIQLFLIPAMIVLVVIGVWGTFNWIVKSGSSDPQQLIAGLDGSSHVRWQRAVELVSMMGHKRNDHIKYNVSFADSIVEILEKTTEAAKNKPGQEDVLRGFLCKLLGEFYVDAGTETLVKVALTEIQVQVDDAEKSTEVKETDVRFNAIQALALRIHNFRNQDPPVVMNEAMVEDALLVLADNENPKLRKAAAFTLGVLATEKSITALEVMVDDPDPSTRYNAAVGLGLQGNAKGYETLLEMLRFDTQVAVLQENKVDAKLAMQAVVIKNGMHGLVTLLNKNPEVDKQPVIELLQKIKNATKEELKKSFIHPRISSDVEQVLKKLTFKKLTVQ